VSGLIRLFSTNEEKCERKLRNSLKMLGMSEQRNGFSGKSCQAFA